MISLTRGTYYHLKQESVKLLKGLSNIHVIIFIMFICTRMQKLIDLKYRRLLTNKMYFFCNAIKLSLNIAKIYCQRYIYNTICYRVYNSTCFLCAPMRGSSVGVRGSGPFLELSTPLCPLNPPPPLGKTFWMLGHGSEVRLSTIPRVP